jgi:hypothetical protein
MDDAAETPATPGRSMRVQWPAPDLVGYAGGWRQCKIVRAMIHLFTLYACLHFTRHAPDHQAGVTRCVDAEAFFRLDECKGNLPAKGGVVHKGKYDRSWLECQVTKAHSWIPADTNREAIEVYKAQARVTDARAMSALLAPLSKRARTVLQGAALTRPFVKSDEGPGYASFFIIGDGQRVVVFAVTNLSGFQFADIAADISSSQESNQGLNFESLAKFAGVKLSYPVITTVPTLHGDGNVRP